MGNKGEVYSNYGTMELDFFTPKEFKMGEVEVYNNMTPAFLLLMDELRKRVGESIYFNSTYRDDDYNESVGGVPDSRHLYGDAADIRCTDSVLRGKILKHALALGLTCGVYENWIHVDNRESQLVYVG